MRTSTEIIYSAPVKIGPRFVYIFLCAALLFEKEVRATFVCARIANSAVILFNIECLVRFVFSRWLPLPPLSSSSLLASVAVSFMPTVTNIIAHKHSESSLIFGQCIAPAFFTFFLV